MAKQVFKKYTEKEEEQIIDAVLGLDYSRMKLGSLMALVMTMLDAYVGINGDAEDFYDKTVEFKVNLSNEMLKYVIFVQGVK